MRRKEYGWFVGLIYDPTEMLEVTTARPGVAGVLHHKRVEISVNIFLTAITRRRPASIQIEPTIRCKKMMNLPSDEA
jgi:hypothetical protein